MREQKKRQKIFTVFLLIATCALLFPCACRYKNDTPDEAFYAITAYEPHGTFTQNSTLRITTQKPQGEVLGFVFEWSGTDKYVILENLNDGVTELELWNFQGGMRFRGIVRGEPCAFCIRSNRWEKGAEVEGTAIRFTRRF